MPQDPKVLAAYGVSAKAYKGHFSKDREELKPKHKKLVDLIAGRIRDGRSLNLAEWRAYHAIDLAFDVPFNQTTPTLLRHILSKNYRTQDEAIADLRAYGLDEKELFLDIETPQGKGRILNVPVLFSVLVPLVKAYSTMRSAYLFNERNTQPFTPYEPLKDTERDKVMAEIITDTQDTIATRMGYPAVLRQAIQQTLRYGTTLAFPREEWWCENRVEDTGDRNEEGKKIFRKVTTREGLRYTIPHPTFMFYDLKYPLTTINTDTGIDFCGYWHVQTWGQILDNKLYWNKKRIFSGTNWFQSPLVGNLFTEIFPCTMKHPNPGMEPMLREDKQAWYNTSSDRDTAVFVTEYYMKLVPKDWDLADYEYPVWHRFTLAGDDTVIWCEPCAYTPAWFMGYDYNDNDSKTSSIALETIPWQDMLGNVLSQMVLTAKQNLTNVIFYDKRMVDEADIRQMENLGESKYKSTTFIGYDSLKTAVQGLSASQAFSPVNLSKTPIQELLQLVPTILSIMERVLQVAAQEAGAQATHQQSKFELQQTGGASSGRVLFLGSFIDEGIDAWKRQRYDASMAYADASISAQVSSDIPNVHQIIEELGFTVKHDGKDKLLVHGKKSGLRLEDFSRSSEGRLAASDKEASQILFSAISTISGQPELFKAIGARNLLSLIEFGVKLAGGPRGFRLKEIQDGEEQEVPQNVIEAIQKAQEALAQSIEEKAIKPIAGEMAQDKQRIDQVEQMIKKLEGIYKIAAAQQDKNTIAQQAAQTKAQIKSQETAGKLQLKGQEAAHAISQKDQEFHAEQQRKNAETAAEIERKRILTEAEIEMKKKAASEKPKQPAIS